MSLSSLLCVVGESELMLAIVVWCSVVEEFNLDVVRFFYSTDLCSFNVYYDNELI